MGWRSEEVQEEQKNRTSLVCNAYANCYKPKWTTQPITNMRKASTASPTTDGSPPVKIIIISFKQQYNILVSVLVPRRVVSSRHIH
jgi:hypothetical protein